MTSPRLFARAPAPAPALSGEVMLRYFFATLVTLIALAAAQLVVSNAFVLPMALITVAGVPLALWLRARDLRVGGFQIPRPLWNAVTMLATGAATAYFLRGPVRNALDALHNGSLDLILSGPNPMIWLVQLFLIFAACRSFSLISDKDATLATVPSFSVLLLLIPIHRGIEVILYFLVWTLVATALFALEHRSELRELTTATVPAAAPGEEVRLAARSLAGVLGISLVAAVALSGFLTARDPKDGTAGESAIAALTSRLTQWTMSGASNGAVGPERQIDFASATTLPTQEVLWRARAQAEGGQTLRPAYWRLFTLSDYDGSTWTQNNEDAQVVARTNLSSAQWPRERVWLRRDGSGISRPDSNPSFDVNATQRAERLRRELSRVRLGFPLDKALMGAQFGTPPQLVGAILTAQRPVLGFVPLLPTPLSLRLPDSDPASIRVRADGGVDVNVVNTGQKVFAYSSVVPLVENGFKTGHVPLERVKARAAAPRLSAAARAENLKLPEKLPQRVRALARATLKDAPASSSNYARALLLASATQKNAIYTLRPPTIPAERDAADFFLFESRRGYCTYFAGALAVLCRAQNIPARVVSGFAPSEMSSDSEILIRDANAHAWVEVWVENWGWATVDATPADDRGDNAPTLLENWGDLFGSKLELLSRWSAAHWPALLGGAGVGLLGALLGFSIRGAREGRNGLLFALARRLLKQLGWGAHASPLEQAQMRRRQISAFYERAARRLSRYFRPRAAWETPDEWLHAARRARPDAPFSELQKLTTLYVRAHFSPLELESDAAWQARQASAQLRWPKRRLWRRTPKS